MEPCSGNTDRKKSLHLYKSTSLVAIVRRCWVDKWRSSSRHGPSNAGLAMCSVQAQLVKTQISPRPFRVSSQADATIRLDTGSHFTLDYKKKFMHKTLWHMLNSRCVIGACLRCIVCARSHCEAQHQDVWNAVNACLTSRQSQCMMLRQPDVQLKHYQPVITSR